MATAIQTASGPHHVCWIKRKRSPGREAAVRAVAFSPPLPKPCTFLLDQVLQVLPLDVEGDVGDEGPVSFRRRAGVRLKAAPSAPLGVFLFPFVTLAGPVAFAATREGRGPESDPATPKTGSTLTLEAKLGKAPRHACPSTER